MTAHALKRRTRVLLGVGVMLALALVGATALSVRDWFRGREIRRSLDREGASGRLISVSYDDTRLEDVVADITSKCGHKVAVVPGTHERVTISLKEIPWRDAVDVIAKMARGGGDSYERDGVVYIGAYSRMTINFTNAPLRTVLELLATDAGDEIWIGSDVGATVDLDYSRCAVDHAPELRKELERLVALSVLHVGRVGRVVFVSTEPVSSPPSTGARQLVATVAASRAPARGFVELLAPYVGAEKVDATTVQGEIDGFSLLADTSFEDVLAAATLANGVQMTREGTVLHVSGGRPSKLGDSNSPSLIDLGDGRLLALRLEGVVIPDERAGKSRALISGHVFAEGDPLLDVFGIPVEGVRVATIESGCVELVIRGERSVACRD